ncbi:hypothetical protein AYI70_g6702 [Smittium culicis]|uniref:Retrotransposon gag domain-containing protein n=1 Tax=Smittium culicis TaxID=133412 RepID=A0A1R1XNU3_9FUNG|nr:hypothetical protein AYI70_g6702 [Smittium culicis]
MVWFDAIITEAAPATTNYEEFSAIFKSHFSDSGYALKSTNQLMTIYQGKRSVAKYASHNEQSNNLSHQAINNQDGAPMNIDALKVRPRAPLSREEKIRRFENGLCLYCASDKHIVPDCGLCTQSLKAKP